MAPVKTRSTSSRHRNDRGYKADPEDTNDDDDFYGMRELKHQLAGLNLQLKDTMGDGNCLFRACADQYFGSEKDHASLRAEVCQYIDHHAEHFKAFLDNETVEAHVAHMRKNGTYGGNIELVAFARMKRVDIKVYQPGYIFVIEGIDVKKEGSSPGQRPIMHIAYHSWEHYSSIRNIDGPHEGLPEINPRSIKQQPLTKLSDQDPPRPVESTIMKVSGVQDLGLVRELMEKYHGDFDSVINDLVERSFEQLYDEESNGTKDSTSAKETKQPSEGPDQKALGKDGALEGKVHKEDVECKDEGKTSGTDGLDQTNRESDPASPSNSTNTDPSIPTLSRPSSRAATPVSRTASPMPLPSSSALPLADEPAKGVVPKKRLSSREKKEQAKRNQKLNRKNKSKTGLPSSPTNRQQEDNSGRDGSGGDAGKSSNMRELFV
ncbi:hypothetical protein EDD11_004139 [Mortierella claussenii]|nr:hypothetical protein EDD11_004139 [Mortierella claussenii]